VARESVEVDLDGTYQTAFLILYVVSKVVENYFIWRMGEKGGSPETTIASSFSLALVWVRAWWTC